MTWHVAATDHRREFHALRHLTDAGLEAFLPHYDKKQRSRRKKGRMESVPTPLYTGYIFAKCEDWRDISACKDIAHVLMLCGTDEAAPIPEAEIEAIRVFCEEENGKMNLKGSREAAIVTGQICRIMDGVWQGFSGRAMSDEKKGRVRVELQTAGNRLTVQLPVELLTDSR